MATVEDEEQILVLMHPMRHLGNCMHLDTCTHIQLRFPGTIEVLLHSVSHGAPLDYEKCNGASSLKRVVQQ